MAEYILMIALSPTMEIGKINKWNKNEGDEIKSGDVICEVETDKASMEYELDMEGTLLKIIVQEGEDIKIGDPIGIIGKKGEKIEGLIAKVKESNKNIPGKTVEKNITTDNNVQNKSGVSTNKDNQNKYSSMGGRPRISPLAMKLADKYGININAIKGSGPGGRIVKRDIESAISSVPHISGSSSDGKAIPLSQMRSIVANRMSESKFSAPHYYLNITVRMDDIMAERKKLNQRQDKKLSMNAFLIKFTAEALKKHPIVNSSWMGDHIFQHNSIDIGLAVALNDGLISPVVRDCGNKGIIQIDKEIKELVEKARNKKIAPEEFSNATFTISNLGSYGIDSFTAIINPPGAAILAIGMIKQEVVVSEIKGFEAASNMKMTLSNDHRILDGAVAAEFLSELKNMLEDPVTVLL